MKIKFLDLSKINKLVLDKSKNQMISHLYKGNYILEKNVSNFEKKFANFNLFFKTYYLKKSPTL